MWTLDLAREQSPTLEHLEGYARFSLDSGYDSLGLYLEHRFAYPSAPWAAGTGDVTPEAVAHLRREFPELTLVPFINLLGHMEGFLYCQEGRTYRESPFRGMQGCPSNKDFVDFCNRLLDDTLQVFDSEIVHIGGDETWELARCGQCSPQDGQDIESRKETLYGGHMGPLSQRVVEAGRRPAVWGDMFLEHPGAMTGLPKETVVFDWQYRNGLKDSSPQLARHGHDIVGCPTLHVYDAAWMHLPESDANVRDVSRDARDLGLAGLCLTTWECGLFGAYDTVLPAVRAARAVMDDPDGAPHLASAYDGEWARLLGTEVNALGGVFAFDGHRHRLKSRLLMYGNPFLAWKHHGDELAGETGEHALELSSKALAATQDEGQRGVALFVRTAVEIVRMMEAGHRWYAQREPEKCVGALSPIRHAFDILETVARRTHERSGGSLADIERCRVAKAHVETVIRRIQNYGRAELGYLPAFDVITHTRFMPHDQACWWGVNKWGDE